MQAVGFAPGRKVRAVGQKQRSAAKVASGASSSLAKAGNGDKKEKKTETRAFTPASVLADLGALASSLF